MLDNNIERVPILVVCHTISSQSNIMTASETKTPNETYICLISMFVDKK